MPNYPPVRTKHIGRWPARAAGAYPGPENGGPNYPSEQLKTQGQGRNMSNGSQDEDRSTGRGRTSNSAGQQTLPANQPAEKPPDRRPSAEGNGGRGGAKNPLDEERDNAGMKIFSGSFSDTRKKGSRYSNG